MNDKDMMEQLLAESKKRTTYTRLAAFGMLGIFIVVLIVCVLLVPQLLDMLTHVDEVVTSAETAMTEISDVAEGIKELDVATLNSAIQDLKDAVEPFANLMNKFK